MRYEEEQEFNGGGGTGFGGLNHVSFHFVLYLRVWTVRVLGMSIFIHGHMRPQPASIQIPVSLHVLMCVWYVRSLSMKCLVKSWRWRFMTKTQTRMISWAGTY